MMSAAVITTTSSALVLSTAIGAPINGGGLSGSATAVPPAIGALAPIVGIDDSPRAVLLTSADNGTPELMAHAATNIVTSETTLSTNEVTAISGEERGKIETLGPDQELKQITDTDQ